MARRGDGMGEKQKGLKSGRRRGKGRKGEVRKFSGIYERNANYVKNRHTRCFCM